MYHTTMGPEPWIWPQCHIISYQKLEDIHVRELRHREM